MVKIKIVSNPYNRNLLYFINRDGAENWNTLEQDSINSKLRETDNEKIFLPFKAKEIIDTIISEYYVGSEKINLVFEGTKDEYDVLEDICSYEDINDKIELSRSDKILENARHILDDTKEIFGNVQPIIQRIIKDDAEITKDLSKVSDALDDIIPICIFGNYSAGKSTFINALIGYEILPSGGDPVTAKIYEIRRSKHPDRALISFSYLGEPFELKFEDNKCSVVKGDKSKDLIAEILSALEEEDPMFIMVNKTIAIINSFEKRDKENTVISNVINIEIPFSENGKLGQSANEFIIFDTPGSNSKTNMDHEKVLEDSLQGFSNGIPIWVSGYDSIDSVDNANLCDRLYKIEALDKRFTMIIINRADAAELPKGGLSEQKIKDIMEYESVEKMYSSGIYFVSSAMGLGAKNIDGIVSEYLLDLFDEKEKKFSDPSARLYKKLYDYNIMPEHMKKQAVESSLACDNLIYANSGLYCVETEMEQFASKYAAYNKCQMVYRFMNSVIDETQKRITSKTARLEKRKQELENELDEKRQRLVESIRAETQNSLKKYDRDSRAFIHTFTREQLVYQCSAEDLEKQDNDYAEQNEKEVNYDSFEQDFEGTKTSRWSNLKDNIRDIVKPIDSRKNAIKNLVSDWSADSELLKQKKSNMLSARKQADEATTDQTMTNVKEKFKADIIDAQDKLQKNEQVYWQQRAEDYRESMIRLITGSDALSEKQQKELSDIILNYPEFEYNDDSDRRFIKTNYLRANLLSNLFGWRERLDIRRLAASYNSEIKKSVNKMAVSDNSSCIEYFKNWQSKLQAIIEENITTYNPELRELSESIRDEAESINELQNNQKTINDSLTTIKSMMEWKEVE